LNKNQILLKKNGKGLRSKHVFLTRHQLVTGLTKTKAVQLDLGNHVTAWNALAGLGEPHKYVLQYMGYSTTIDFYSTLKIYFL